MQIATATPHAVVSTSLAIAGAVQLENLTISPDVMPHHFIARAVILDLQPFQMVAAILATEAAIRTTYPQAHRSGWSATSDGLRIYFHAWSLTGGAR
jgi:hypothetical protein